MRQFLLKDEPSADGIVTVTGKDFRYLAQVLRLQCGDGIDVRLPCGKLSHMRIISRENGKLIMQQEDKDSVKSLADFGSSVEGGVQAGTVDKEMASSVSDSTIWLLQCLPKAAKMDGIIRQVTEAGVERIYTVVSDRSVFEEKASTASKMERWKRIVREARQQSASPVQTEVFRPQRLHAVIEDIQNEIALRKSQNLVFTERALVLTEAPLAESSLHQYLGTKPNLVIVAVGSEGGISPAELAELYEAGFMPFHFVTNVLRTETAAIYGIASVQTILTEYYSWQLKE